MISDSVIRLCRKVQGAGGRALLVGGWVRDYVRGFETVDYDIEVYGIEAADLRRLLGEFGQVNAVGEAFTVYKVRLRDDGGGRVIDVSLPRRESKVGRGHRGFIVTGDPRMSLEEAALRRDFTINAMIYDPLTGEYIDPYGGREDIRRRLIRVVDPATFIEDSLRVLRAMQFASRFEFEIDPATVDLCRTIDLSDLPAERVWAEVEKWLLQSRMPSIGWRAADELRIVDRLWPEIGAMRIAAPHRFAQTAVRLDQARKLIDDLVRPKQIAVMLASLVYDLDDYDHPGSEANRLNLIEGFLNRLRLFTLDHYHVRRQVLALAKHQTDPRRWFGRIVSDGEFRRLALQVEPGLLYRVSLADNLSRGGDAQPEIEQWFISRVRELGIEARAPEPLLLGRHLLALGLQPGPRVGQITKAVYQMQLDGQVATVEDAIAAARRLVAE